MTRSTALRAFLLGLTIVLTMPGAVSHAVDEQFVLAPDAPIIEVAIVLDTSGSMKPLIDAARLKLWEIVNELTLLDPAPQLRVALLTFGNNKNDSKNGWIRVETPLTNDLDLVSERLFELETSGGNEYVGRVLKAAVEQLDWSDSRDTLKLVFVAGNESADQDQQVSSRSVAVDADRKDLIVHTIYCGNPEHDDALTWKELAETARGQFASIDHRSKGVIVETPYDAQLADLSKALNQTYVPMGEAGATGLEAQVTQDANALSLSPAAAASRAQTKVGPMYSREWDLLDALDAGSVSLYEIDESELPEAMQTMTTDEMEVYVEDLRQKRDALRSQILDLSAQRRSYVAEQVKKKGLDDTRTFDGVVRRAILDQVEEKGFTSSENP
jgi:chorismate mutase